MTVKELSEALKQMPEDAEVYINAYYVEKPAEKVHVTSGYRVIDGVCEICEIM